MSKKLDAVSALKAKREALDAKILAAEQFELRKNKLVKSPEFCKLLSLPDDVILAEFSRIGSEQKGGAK